MEKKFLTWKILIAFIWIGVIEVIISLIIATLNMTGHYHKGNFGIVIIGIILLYSARTVHSGFDKISILSSFKEVTENTAKPGNNNGLTMRVVGVFFAISNAIISGLIIYANLT